MTLHPFFAIGLPHGMDWVWVALVVILIFGADKIPKLARGLGRSLGEFKKAKEDFEKELHSAATSSTTPTAPTVTASPGATPVLDDKLRVPPAGTETGVSTGSAGSVDELTKKI